MNDHRKVTKTMAPVKKIALHMIMQEQFETRSSKNHQFSLLKDRVYSRFAKTTVGGLAFVRLNPADNDQTLDGILISHEDSYNIETKAWSFDYRTDVIELYSEVEHTYFVAVNRQLISAGKLIPYAGTDTLPDTPVAIMPGDITSIVKLSDAAFIETINGITEETTLQRIKMALTRSDSLIKHENIVNRIKAVNLDMPQLTRQ